MAALGSESARVTCERGTATRRRRARARRGAAPTAAAAAAAAAAARVVRVDDASVVRVEQVGYEGRPADDTMVADMVAGYGCANGEEVDHAVDERVHVVRGAIPRELCGTWYHNGPGRMERGGVVLSQPFDGDGLITALSLRDGRAHFRSRFVQTRAYIEEEREGRWLYRGAFASGNPSGGLFFNPFDFSAKNVSNTGLLPWRAGGELLSLHEAGLPHRVDGRTLRTLGGETDLGGVVEGGVLAAHPRTTHDRIINFSAEQGQGEGRLTFYEWERRRASDDAPAASAAAPTTANPDPDPEPALLSKVSFGGVAGLGFYHDHAITSKYYCVVENPTSIDTRRLLLEYMIGRCSIAETIAFDEERPMVLHLLPRPGRPGGEAGAEGPGAAQRLRFDIGPGFVFHLINAFDVAPDATSGMPEGGVVVDAVLWRRVDFGRTAQLDRVGPEDYVDGDRPMAERIVIDFATGEVRRRVLTDRAVEFGDVAREGEPCAHAYLAAGCYGHPNEWGPAMGVMKLTPGGYTSEGDEAEAEVSHCLVRAMGARRLVNEPLFVPRDNATAEDDGWLLVQVYDAEEHGRPRVRVRVLVSERAQKRGASVCVRSC